MKSGESKAYRHPNAETLYMAIPAKMAQDSTFPFKAGDILELDVVGKTIVVKKKA